MMSGLKSALSPFKIWDVSVWFSLLLSAVSPERRHQGGRGVGGAGGGRGVTQERSWGQQRGAVHVPSTPRTAGSQSEASFEACLEGADMRGTGHHSRVGSFSLGPSLEVLRME